MVSYLNHCRKYASFTFVFVQRSWKYLDICRTCCTQYFMVTVSRAPTLNETVFGYTCMPCTLFSLLHGPLSAAHIFIQDIQYMDICLTCNTQCYNQCQPRAYFIRDIGIWTPASHFILSITWSLSAVNQRYARHSIFEHVSYIFLY